MTQIPKEAIEAARQAYVRELPETALYPSQFAMSAALEAALPFLPIARTTARPSEGRAAAPGFA